MAQLLVSQELVLMLLLPFQNPSILIHYVKVSCRAVFGMENQLEDAKMLLLLALVIQEQLKLAVYSLNLDKNALKQRDFVKLHIQYQNLAIQILFQHHCLQLLLPRYFANNLFIMMEVMSIVI